MNYYKIVFLLAGMVICSASANTDADIKPKFFRIEQKMHDVNAQLKEISELIIMDFPTHKIQTEWNRVQEEYKRAADELNIILFQHSRSLEWETLLKLGQELSKNFINTQNTINNYLKKHSID